MSVGMIVFSVVTLFGTTSVQGQQSPPSPLGELPHGATFSAITDPSTQELVLASGLVQVFRSTWKEGLASIGACFDSSTGGPQILLIESGELSFGVTEPERGAEGLPILGIPTLYRAGVDQPAAVLPNTNLTLATGDLVVSPNGTECLTIIDPDQSEVPIVTLDVRFFPDSSPPSSDERADIQAFDANFGLRTANPGPPPVVAAGLLRLEPGASLELDSSVPPFVLAVRAGGAEITTDSDSGIVRRAEFERFDSSAPIAPDDPTELNVGDRVYVPPSTSGVLTNVGGTIMSAMVIAVVPALARVATPTPA